MRHPGNFDWYKFFTISAIVVGVGFFLTSLILSKIVFNAKDGEIEKEQVQVPSLRSPDGHPVVSAVQEKANAPAQPKRGTVSSTTKGDFSAPSTPDKEVSTKVSDEGQTVPSAAGEFPEVPEGYPLKPIWTAPGFVRENFSRLDERISLDKVLIKLWKQGDHNFANGCTMNGLVYPLYPNTIYVRWKEFEFPDGTKKRVVGGIIGRGDVKLPPRPIFEDLIPPGVRVIDLDSEEGRGIDPDEFLQNN